MLQQPIIQETRAQGITRLLPASRAQFLAKYPYLASQPDSLSKRDTVERGARYVAELALDDERRQDAKAARKMGQGL